MTETYLFVFILFFPHRIDVIQQHMTIFLQLWCVPFQNVIFIRVRVSILYHWKSMVFCSRWQKYLKVSYRFFSTCHIYLDCVRETKDSDTHPHTLLLTWNKSTSNSPSGFEQIEFHICDLNCILLMCMKAYFLKKGHRYFLVETGLISKLCV